MEFDHGDNSFGEEEFALQRRSCNRRVRYLVKEAETGEQDIWLRRQKQESKIPIWAEFTFGVGRSRDMP